MSFPDSQFPLHRFQIKCKAAHLFDRNPLLPPKPSASANPSLQESMGLLSWWKGKGASPPPPPSSTSPATIQDARPKSGSSAAKEEVPGMNGAVEVRRPEDVAVFEFGSVAASGDRVTLAGYCPVSEELEPCRWEIIPAAGSNAPQFRIVF